MLTTLLLCSAAVAAFLLYRHFQRGAHVVGGFIDAPPAVRTAAKRLGFRAQPNVHSIVSLHSPDLCVAAMAVAFARMDENTTLADATLAASLTKHLQIDPSEVDDAIILSAWLVDQGGGPTSAFERLTKRLKQLDHGPYFSKMMSVLGDVTAAGTRGMPSAPQADAMGALARIFRTA
ncbi:hypothetical protein OS189_08080 [Sulfitobacter sp. F26169L]|uniref:hypothetical protein n=1 Tax=Sulfitobacter sp. F26169L TaxID=2996015 RepID=UPI002260AA13|nr:hypothetical protein [Sulfitobacter sp. F26169L]MCX7566299.1 hypothetical protein [Sulfitobacter sp. F26169L]